MLTIDRLRLHLPSGYRHRSASIGRLLAEELARIPLGRDLQIENLRLPSITIASGESDRRIARKITAAVAQRIETSKPEWPIAGPSPAQR